MSRGEIEELKDQLSSLRVRVYAQEDRIGELEQRLREVEGGARPPKELEECTEDRASLASYSLVSERPTVRIETGSGPIEAQDRESRERLARGCGQFLRRALAGDFRGSSST